MSVFEEPEFDHHEEVVFCHDRDAGLQGIIAIHDRTLGPALGGTRMWPYPSDDEALNDALRLSRGMTYKAALADVPYGGGKAVIIGDPRRQKTPALWIAFARFLNNLHGRFITGEDVGTNVADMDFLKQFTPYVAGTTPGGVGDPSPATAWGVFHGIRAAVAHKFGMSELKGLRVAVQGLGHVGFALCRLLNDAGAKLVVADIDERRVQNAVAEFGAEEVGADAILAAPCDVLAPCALGAIVNAETIPQIKAAVIAGSANNQLASPEHAEDLEDRGILLAPDYVINAGGLMAIAQEGPNYDRTKAFERIARIHDTLRDLFKESERLAIPPTRLADRRAKERLERAQRRRASGLNEPFATSQQAELLELALH
jgi:leucine dehydrogenase